MANRKHQTIRNAALMECMVFFRDELDYGTLTERQRTRITQLLNLVDDVMDHPSVADANRYRTKANACTN